tara:strand:+ start:14406 stop:15140 length:735 start_codon:yes stop_codon:yes gene_type:complete
MKIIAVIPARYEAKRFPGKLLKMLGNRTIIEQTFLAASSTNLFDDVIVVTDDKRIFSTITEIGGKAIMSMGEFHCGSDRIAAAVADMDIDIIVNIQGDEPFMEKESLSSLIQVLKNDLNHDISLASLMTPIYEQNIINDPNTVKVIVDNDDFAIYFSRHPIPYNRDNNKLVDYFKHIGVYAFRKDALIEFYNQSMTPLEKSEKIECLRYIENSKKIKMISTSFEGISIDTLEDLNLAKSKWHKK